MRFLLLFCLLFGQLSGAFAFTTFEDEVYEINSNLKYCGTYADGKALERHLKKKYSVDNEEKILFFGIEMKGVRSELVQHMISLLQVDGYKKESYFPYPLLEKKFKGISSCKDMFCMADKAFGKGKGAFYLYFMDEYNLNLSHIANELDLSGEDLLIQNTKSFSMSELQLIYQSLEMMPKGAFENFEYGTHVKRIDESRGSTLAVASQRYLKFYDLWGSSRISREVKIVTVIHELGHKIGTFYEQVDLSDEWLKLSGWRMPEKTFKYAVNASRDMSKSNFVSDYAATNPYEDFAETFSAYILTPKFVKTRAPKKYRFMRDVIFGGRPTICARREKSNFLIELPEGIEQQKEIANTCLDSFVANIRSLNMIPFQRCLAKNAANLDSLPINYSPADLEQMLESDPNYRSIVEEEVDTFIGTTTDYFKDCKTMQYMAFDTAKFSTYPVDLFRFVPDLCRWSHRLLDNQNKNKNQKYNNEELKGALKTILMQRMKL